MPMARWDLGVDTLAFGGSATLTGQIGLGPRFIQKDQFGRVQAGLLPTPGPPRPRNVWTVLFAGPERLFLYVSPIFAKT